jgi:hypothetical protein
MRPVCSTTKEAADCQAPKRHKGAIESADEDSVGVGSLRGGREEGEGRKQEQAYAGSTHRL